MLATKDNAGFLRNFAGLSRHVIVVPVPRQDKSVPAETLVDIARGVGLPAESRNSVEAALAAVARLELMPAPRILITGSLYLAGEVLALNGTPPN
jgi:dihydrofolate synthase/folylpolyglutamate synthase